MYQIGAGTAEGERKNAALLQELEKNLKFKSVFQRKIFTLCMCLCVCVLVSLCSAMQLAIQWYVITPTVFDVSSVT